MSRERRTGTSSKDVGKRARAAQGMGGTAISILIPWSNREELETTLSSNRPWLPKELVEVIVLNCGGNSVHLHDLIARTNVAGIRQIDISATQFNKSLAINIGMYVSRFP